MEGLIRRSRHFGDAIILALCDDFTIGYAKNENELLALLEFLAESAYVRKSAEPRRSGHRYIVSAPGYEHAQNRKKSNAESAIVFVAMWFGGESNKAWMDDVWENGIKPALEEVGFDPRRVDLEEHNDDVIYRMLALIRESRFIVADFTGQRNGVYFEAGFAKGLGLDVIWCCNVDHMDESHFDTNHFNHICWSESVDLRERLKSRIHATVGHGPLEPRA